MSIFVFFRSVKVCCEFFIRVTMDCVSNDYEFSCLFLLHENIVGDIGKDFFIDI